MELSLYDVLNNVRAVDESIKELSRKKLENPDRLLESRKRLTAVENRFKEKHSQLDAEKVKKNQFTQILEGEREGLQKAEEKLGEVRNNKEYRAALKEIDQHKKTINTLKQQETVASETIETLSKEFEEVEAEFKKVSLEHESILINIKDNINMIERELADIGEEKDNILKSLPDDVRNKYMKAYESKGGIGVAIVSNGRCSICNMVLPPQFCNQILKGDKVYHCPSCQRLIIYIKEE